MSYDKETPESLAKAKAILPLVEAAGQTSTAKLLREEIQKVELELQYRKKH